MQQAYNIAFRLLGMPLRWHLARRVRRGKELAPRLRERFGFASQPRPVGKLVWLHGASNGEILSLLPIVERLRALYHPPAILMTSGTVSSAALIEKRLPAGCIHQFLPLDHPAWVKRFLNHWHPDGVLWVESELWPGILSEIRARKIPVALLNARFSGKSNRNWLLFPKWARKLADTFLVVTAQTPGDAKRWEQMGGLAKPQLLGNLKFISAPLPCNPEALAVLHGELGDRPLWLLASAHPGEEAVARDVHKYLERKFPGLLTIIVPRHTQNGFKFAEALQGAGLVTALRSQHEPINPETHIYIADTIGELGLFYRLSRLSVIGGTFVPVGGHSPIEPAMLGSFPLYGPYIFSQKSICAAFEAAGASQPVVDAVELAQALENLLENPTELQCLCNAARAVCENESQSGPLIWDALMSWREKAGLQ